MESYSCFHRFEVVAGKNIRQQTYCLYVLSYSLPLFCQGPKSNLLQLRKISAGNHSDRNNSKIAYSAELKLSFNSHLIISYHDAPNSAYSNKRFILFTESFSCAFLEPRPHDLYTHPRLPLNITITPLTVTSHLFWARK